MEESKVMAVTQRCLTVNGLGTCKDGTLYRPQMADHCVDSPEPKDSADIRACVCQGSRWKKFVGER
jgi:hypothetical protein